MQMSDYSGADILKLKFDGYNSSEKVIEFVGCRVFNHSGKLLIIKLKRLKAL